VRDTAERLAGFLRARHPVKTAASVVAETGGQVTAAAVEKWLRIEARPGLPAVVVLIEAYGPDLVAVLAPGLSWLSRRAALDDIAELTRIEHEARTVAARLRSELSRRA